MNKKSIEINHFFKAIVFSIFVCTILLFSSFTTAIVTATNDQMNIDTTHLGDYNAMNQKKQISSYDQQNKNQDDVDTTPVLFDSFLKKPEAFNNPKEISDSFSINPSFDNSIEKTTTLRKISDRNQDQLQDANADFIPGEILVKFINPLPSIQITNGRVMTSEQSLDELMQKYEISSMQQVYLEKGLVDDAFSQVFTLMFSPDTDVNAVVSDFQKNPYIEYAEPNGIYEIAEIPNDQRFEYQWGMHNTGQTEGTPDADIDAPEAWDLETGNNDTIIAIIDSGVDYYHEDLAEKMWINSGEDIDGDGVVTGNDINGIDDDDNGYVDDIRGWDFAYYDNDPNDVNTHGTHCAGIAAAVASNSIGVAGVCWHCRIMPVKCLNDAGTCGWTELARSIVYATDMGADVISMSIQGDSYSNTLAEAVSYAISRDVVVVAAAGNWNCYDCYSYPAAYGGVISVAATDHNDQKASFSNYGEWISVAAPGVNTLSTIPDNLYGYMSGTSMATPHVAGLAALIKSRVPQFSNSRIAQQIISTTDNIDGVNPEYVGLLGSGRINAFRAIQIFNHNVGISSIELSPQSLPRPEPLHIAVTVYNNGMNNEIFSTLTLNANDIEIINHTIYYLPYSSSTVIDITWTPPDVGQYIITADVSLQYEIDEYPDDNEKTTILSVGVLNAETREYFSTIQQAIDDIDTISGHHIVVSTGVYPENIIIMKGIILVGSDKNSTIISGVSSEENTVTINNTDAVSISGLSLTDGLHGLAIFSSSGSQICNLEIYNNINSGIFLENAVNSTLSGNSINHNSNGINVTASTVSSMITDNIIFDNQQGIIVGTKGGNNQIYHNQFINILNAIDNDYNSIWDNGYHNGYHPGGGNYWSDYYGIDERSGSNQDQPGPDSIGDTPYNISGNGHDHYPLMIPGHLPREIFIDDDNVEGPWEGTSEYPYRSILDALDVASERDFLSVRSGNYYGSLDLNLPINIVGEDPTSTFIIGDSWYDILVSANNTVIRNFTCVNDRYQDTAILLCGVTHCTITDCTFITGGIVFASREGYVDEELTFEQWTSHTIENIYSYDGRIYYFKNIQGPFVVPDDAVQIILANCSYAIIENINFSSDVAMAIQLGYSINTHITNVGITNQYFSGVILRNSPYTVLQANTIVNLESTDCWAIEALADSDYLIISNQYFHNAGYYSIYSNGCSNITIEDCIFVKGSDVAYGIQILNGINVTVFNSTFNSFSTTISLRNIDRLNFRGNTIRESSFSLMCSYITNSQIMNNTINNPGYYGIQGYSLVNCIFSNNVIYSNPLFQNRQYGRGYLGITLIDSVDNILTNNNLFSTGINLESSTYDLDHFSSNQFENNMVNGKPFYFYKDSIGPFVVPADAGQILIVNCTYFTVQRSEIDDVSTAIMLFDSNFCTIENVSVSNSNIGLLIFGSFNNIQGCNLYDNRQSSIYILGNSNLILNCAVHDDEYMGITIYKGLNNRVENSTVYNLSGSNDWTLRYGIIIGDIEQIGESISNNEVFNCDLYNNDDGGIWIYASENNNISHNSIHDNRGNGIYISGSSNNTIYENLIQNTLSKPYYENGESGIGISIDVYDSWGNTITHNTIIGNEKGLDIELGQDANNIYHNNFMNNIQPSTDYGPNNWDNGYPSGGNFWDDYTGIDADDDGIGDTPYPISGGENNDQYPFINPLSTTYPIPDPIMVYVDDDYEVNMGGFGFNRFDSIQDGCNAVASGGIVHVASGSYTENVRINKPLSCIGENQGTVLIRPATDEPTFHIDHTHKVLIQNLTVADATTGLLVDTSDYVTVKNTLIIHNSDGLVLRSSQYIKIFNNYIQNCSEVGITFIETLHSDIIYNNILNNAQGLQVSSDSAQNNIYCNNFESTGFNAEDNGIDNHWSSNYLLGNYWSDYTGLDDNEDGIGDTPYAINGNNAFDQYPLMTPSNEATERVINLNTQKVYTAIQQAIDDPATSDYHTIFIRSGEYHENLIVDKSLQFYGEDKETTILIGDVNPVENGMYITANGVSVVGFTIQNCGWYALYIESQGNIIRDMILTNNAGGIVLGLSSNNVIERNIISNNGRYGIWVTDSVDTKIIRNEIIHNSYDGIIVGAEAPGYPGCSNLLIEGNSLTNNNRGINVGFYADGTPRVPIQRNISIISNSFTITGVPIHFGGVRDSIISLNTFAGNKHCDYAELMSSSFNEIKHNIFADEGEAIIFRSLASQNKFFENIMSNCVVGAEFDQANNNKIYHNNYINNSCSGIDGAAGNIWDDGYPSGGNYWSDYTGIDEDGDNIGDTPYTNIAGPYPPSQDRYPLIHQFVSSLIVTCKGPYTGATHEQIPFSSYTFGGSPPYISWHWIFGDGATSEESTPCHQYTQPGEYTVAVIVTDSQGNTAQDVTTVTIGTMIQQPPVQNLNQGTGYWYIQEAIDDANPGDTIFVGSGQYYENITISHPLTLIGESRETTTIDSVYSDTIHVYSNNVSISGFTIQNTYFNTALILNGSNISITDNIFRDSMDTEYFAGDSIEIPGATMVIISDNIFDQRCSAVNAMYLSDSIITRNFIQPEEWISSSALSIQYGQRITISENEIHHPGSIGIDIDDTMHSFIYKNNVNSSTGISVSYSNYNTLKYNTITAGDDGIVIGPSSANTITENTIKNTIYGNGIRVCRYIYNNIFYHNNFINNPCNAYDDSTSTWYNTTLLEGNYWDDYTGIDANGDGIGDTPYNIPGGTNQDLYPLMNPWSLVIPGDLNHDGAVNLDDLAQLLAHYGMTSGVTYEMGDIDGDGDVDFRDLSELLSHYGENQ